MMNTLQEEEESKGTNDEVDSSPPTPDPSRARRPSLFRQHEEIKQASTSGDKKQDRKMEERRDSERRGSRDPHVPTILETQPTPRPHRRNSVFETVFQVLRRGSHAGMDTGRRPSPGSAEMHTIPPSTLFPARASDNGAVQKASSRTLIPPNHVSFRRPSGIVTFNPDLMNPNQKRYIMGLLQSSNGSNTSLPEIYQDSNQKKKEKSGKCEVGNDAFVSVMSAFYAKFLFVIGIAFPVTEVLSARVSTHYYQGFYLFLYMGSLAFMTFMYMSLLKDRAITQLIKSSFDVEDQDLERIQNKRGRRGLKRVERYGSFYLRLGAVAFGIGSMVYSGLEFGQYFELKEDSECHNLVQAITPVTRMILTLVQMQFIFLNSRHMEMSRYRGIARFGLMHMVATNMCEWLYVIVEETKHEIIHIVDHSKTPHHGNHSDSHSRHERGTDLHDIFECRRGHVMGSLVQDASPFLFPCTIEYSLICAVIMFEMWKTVKNAPEEAADDKKQPISRSSSKSSEDLEKSNNQFSVDCSNAHKGLFSGILILVITIISLIMFFVMNKDPVYNEIATNEVHIWELIMYILSTIVVVFGGWQMRFLKYKLKDRLTGLGLDNMLLMWAQSGIYIYCMFSTIACYFMVPSFSPAGMVTEVINLVQSTVQTVFILDATFRRTETIEQYRNKPGRQIITFLLVSNMALWLINTLQKSRAEFRPTHSEFYGVWAWTIITHVSMPLAIFFRFHSTICLFEVWKNAYKFKHGHNQVQLLGAAAEH